MSKAVKPVSLRPLRSGDNPPRCSAVGTRLFIDMYCVAQSDGVLYRLGLAS